MKRYLTLILQVSVVPVVVAIAAISATAAEPIRIQIAGEPSTLDPGKFTDQYAYGILRNLLKGLYTLDHDGALLVGLADSTMVSPDQLTYRFRLKSGARYSDGTPIRLEDFVTALRRVVDPKTASPDADKFFDILNAKSVFRGQKPGIELGVQVEKDELKIILEHPSPRFLLALTLPAAAPLRAEWLTSNRGIWSVKFPTSGDYFVKNYRIAEKLELAPNPYADHLGQPIQYFILPEEVTAMNLFEAGRLDILSSVSLSEIDRLKKKGLIQTVPSTTVFYIGFNMKSPVFRNLAMRQAVASSVERQQTASLLHGAFTPIASYIPKTIEPSIEARDFEFKEAVQKIRQSPFTGQVQMSFGASEMTKIVTEKLQSDLKSKLGLTLTLQPTDLKTLLARLKNDPPEMYFLGMSAFYHDNTHHLAAFSAELEENFSRYQSPEFESLLSRLREQPDGQMSQKLLREANSLLVEKDVVLVPMISRLQVIGVSPKIKGFHLSPYQVLSLRELQRQQ